MRKYWIVLTLLLVFICSSALASTLIIPAGTKIIEEEAFYGDTSLDEVFLPAGLNRIGGRSFSNSSVKTIHIPSSVNSFGEDIFSGCTSPSIVGEVGSPAEVYAEEHGFHFIAEWSSTALSDFTFRQLDDFTSEITSYNGTSESVIIPRLDNNFKTVISIGEIKRKVAPEKAHKREPRYLGFPFVAQAFLSLNNPQTPSFANGASLVSPLPLIERHK